MYARRYMAGRDDPLRRCVDGENRLWTLGTPCTLNFSTRNVERRRQIRIESRLGPTHDRVRSATRMGRRIARVVLCTDMRGPSVRAVLTLQRLSPCISSVSTEALNKNLTG